MRARFSCALVVVMVASLAVGATDSASQLKARADAAEGGDKAKLCLQYARLQLENANALFDQGEVEKAQDDVREVVDYAHKAADAASSSGHHLKQTEIDLRKLSTRLHDVGESLAFDDRPQVRKAFEEIEQIRSDLLTRMFGPQSAPKGKS